jgi:hypothetical protein
METQEDDFSRWLRLAAGDMARGIGMTSYPGKHYDIFLNARWMGRLWGRNERDAKAALCRAYHLDPERGMWLVRESPWPPPVTVESVNDNA